MPRGLGLGRVIRHRHHQNDLFERVIERTFEALDGVRLYRPTECSRTEKVSMNAMSFAGSIFVRRSEHMELVREAGPMALLDAVTYPKTP